MISIVETETFSGWLSRLRDRGAAARIKVRIERLARGNFGDAKFFENIGEMRIDHGPGYRVYFIRRGATIVILLCGGDKRTQSRDIKTAKRMAAQLE